MNNSILKLETAIRVALVDYFRYTNTHDICADDFSEAFVSRLAKDSWKAKAELRQLFRKSPAWNEDLQAIVINGNRTHEPDYDKICYWIKKLLTDKIDEVANTEGTLQVDKLFCAMAFFYCQNEENQNLKARYLDALKEIAPKAYREGKKLSRVFKDFCKVLGVTAETNKDFTRLYAKIADEMTARKIDFKLYVSINPAHFLTMSNPQEDPRDGLRMTSCHSLNSDMVYKNGCSGYARDNYTFIAFTASTPDNPETLNNHKTSRQIFAYKPYNGVLLQSRMYTTFNNNSDYGGVDYETPEGELYRDLIQREISFCEDTPNLWHKKEYYVGNNYGIKIETGEGFGGYPDWKYPKMNAIISVRKDDTPHQNFEMGTYGLCINCGEECSEGLKCEDCADHCRHCGHICDEGELTLAYDAYGNEVWVCQDCLNEYYIWCEHCEQYHHYEAVTYVESEGIYVCDSCLDENYECCPHCGEWYRIENMTVVSNGNYVCENCLDDNYTRCAECGDWIYNEYITTAVDSHGEEVYVCDDCIENWYVNCIDCGSYVHIDGAEEVDGGHLCPNCRHNHNDENEEEN